MTDSTLILLLYFSGYLEENGCKQASKHLLQELPALSECAQLLKKGRKVTMRIGNKTLHDMLTDYEDSKEHSKHLNLCSLA